MPPGGAVVNLIVPAVECCQLFSSGVHSLGDPPKSMACAVGLDQAPYGCPVRRTRALLFNLPVFPAPQEGDCQHGVPGLPPHDPDSMTVEQPFLLGVVAFLLLLPDDPGFGGERARFDGQCPAEVAWWGLLTFHVYWRGLAFSLCLLGNSPPVWRGRVVVPWTGFEPASRVLETPAQPG